MLQAIRKRQDAARQMIMSSKKEKVESTKEPSLFAHSAMSSSRQKPLTFWKLV